MPNTNVITETRHTEDMQDIITQVPGSLLRWGNTGFLVVLLLIITLASFVRYPDVVNAKLKINANNSPKPVIAKISGKLVRLLVNENQHVTIGQSLAYLESTANHIKVLTLLSNLALLQRQVLNNKPVDRSLFNESDNVEFGELQSAYQIFFQEYIIYKSSIEDGFLLKKRIYLQKDLDNLHKQKLQLQAQKTIQEKDFSLANDEYEMHKKLAQQKVETNAEFRQQESKYLTSKTPLMQTASSLLADDNNYAAKQKEILELDNQVQEEKAKFLQALNSMLSNAEDWKNKYVLTASQAGKLSYAGILQENQSLTASQEVFYIDPGDGSFYGEMEIPQNNMGKVKQDQQVLIKLKGYPFEEYGMLHGKIVYIADVPYKDSVFISKVDLKRQSFSDLKNQFI